MLDWHFLEFLEKFQGILLLFNKNQLSPYSGENWFWKFPESSAKPHAIFFFLERMK